MVNEELVAIIRERFQQNQRRNEIKDALIEEGYEETEIDAAIAHIQHDAIKQLPGISHMYQFIEDMEQKTDHASPKVVGLVLAGCFAVLLLIFGGLYYWLDPLGINTTERDKQRETDVVKLRTAIDAFYIAEKAYPANLQDLVPEYLQALPLDPKTGAQYSYKAMNGNRVYELCVTFEINPPQCLSSSQNTSTEPMVIVTPTPTQNPQEEPVADEEATSPPDSAEEAPVAMPTEIPGAATDPESQAL